ncbi:MAG: ATP-binding cassette domain-containing protein [Thermales bacterium]|nr:ATP-binding cassette domain-containing protein [Thermales bacterium]
MPVLQTSCLTKTYSNNRGAKSIDIKIDYGEIVGFIGPNGAGKSTTLNMCNGFIIPNSGTIEIFEQNITHLNIHQIYHKIGILSSEVAFDTYLTPRKIFQENQALFQQDYSQNWSRLAKFLELDLDTKFNKLSLGNKKKSWCYQFNNA